MANRDLVVVGASAGGILALRDLIAILPPLPAALLVVVHSSPEGDGFLPEVLTRGGTWPARYARDGERIGHHRVYLAPADHHLLIRSGRLRLSRGPRENRFRPAIDPLFRTAAHEFGPRVIGVVLSGALDDGSHGLELIKRHGGLAVVQDPAEALIPSMPLSAIRNVEVDYILKAAEIGRRLPDLVAEEIGDVRPIAAGEADVAEGTAERFVSGPPSELTCPECGGALWELGGVRVLRYRCHVGHGYTADSLLADQHDGLENALWTALRALEEHSMLRRRMSEHAAQSGNRAAARAFERDARETELRASTIRGLLRREPPRTSAGATAVGQRRSPRKPVAPRPGTRTRRINR